MAKIGNKSTKGNEATTKAVTEGPVMDATRKNATIDAKGQDL